MRQELRPIDGIYHAAFVSAREALAMRKIISNSCEKKKESGFDWLDLYFKDTLADSTLSFNDSLTVIRKHGRLSRLGSAILRDIEIAMNKSSI